MGEMLPTANSLLVKRLLKKRALPEGFFSSDEKKKAENTMIGSQDKVIMMV